MRHFLSLCFLLLIPLYLFSETVTPFLFPSARLSGMGGRHSALVDDFGSLFINPAGFVGVKDELSVAEMTVSVYGPIFDIVNITREFLDEASSFDISPLIGPGGFATGANIAGPLSFGWVGRGLGFGFFNRTYTDAKAVGMKLEASANEEFLVLGGYAFRLLKKDNHILDAGFLGKGFLRGSMSLETSIVNVQSIFDDDMIENQPFNTVAGVGLDIGILYNFSKLISTALVCHDIFSPALKNTYPSTQSFLDGESGSEAYVTLKSNLDFGLSYTPHFALLDRYFSGFSISLAYKDILDLVNPIPRNPILNIGLGVELVVLDALSLRAGINDMLPSLGFGIDFSFMQLDFAMRGVELGMDPGVQTTYAIDLGLLFRY